MKLEGVVTNVIVMEVDVARKRIALSAKIGAKPERESKNSKGKVDNRSQAKKSYSQKNYNKPRSNNNQANNPFGSLADAFKKAKKK